MLIGIVEPNHLAACYLQLILGPVCRIHSIVNNTDLRSRSQIDTACPISVLIVDMGTLGPAFTRLIEMKRMYWPEAKMVVLDKELSVDRLTDLISRGVHGFVQYGHVKLKLARAVHAVYQGKMFFSRHLLEQYIHYSANQTGTRRTGASLTQREGRIIELLQEGLSNKQIGSALLISSNTVKFHLANIFRKLGIHDRDSVAEFGAAGSGPKDRPTPGSYPVGWGDTHPLSMVDLPTVSN